MKVYLTDAEETELMEGAGIPEVGDIIQVTDLSTDNQYFKLGDIGRVDYARDSEEILRVDFSISRSPYKGPTDLHVWNILKSCVTKINVIKEEGETDADRQEAYDNEEEP